MTALAVGLAACGGGSDSSSSDSSKAGEPTKVDLSGGKKGGKVTFLAAADIDYADPGQTYYTFGFMVQQAINRAAVLFKPDDSTKPVPDLATGPPEISSDNKTITVHIRKGVKYRPPVNREVTTADIKYAFERAFSKQVPSGYAGTYFSTIEGTPAKPNTGDIKPISGITTPDKYTIVFKLKEPQAPLVSQALVLPITVPVPEEYAKKFDAKTPSTYDQYVAMTGPYMIQNDSSGKLIGRKPGKQITLVRNPNWDGKAQGDYRPAYLDGVTIEEGNDQLEVASRRVAERQRPDVLRRRLAAGAGPEVGDARSNKDQIAFVPSGGTRYIAMNTKVKPFDNINVRKAVIAGFDKNALRQTRGGKLLGDIATGWIPPGIPGFEEAGGLTQGKRVRLRHEADRRHGARQAVLREGQGRGRADRRQRALRRQGEAADHRDERRPRQEDRRGRPEPVLEAGLQAPVPDRPAGHAVHEVLRRAEREGRDLPERRVVQGLHGPAGDAGCHVQRQNILQQGNVELAAAQRPARSTPP